MVIKSQLCWQGCLNWWQRIGVETAGYMITYAAAACDDY